MAGRSTFTHAEIQTLRALIREKQTADRNRQKTLRATMRRLGFYITDFADYSGFTASDFDELIRRGTITVSDAHARPNVHGPADRPHRPAEAAEAAEAAQQRADAEDEWYEALREQYRPRRIRVLLIAESPPDPGDGDRRFFYSPALSYDNLYRGVAEAVYGRENAFDVHKKPAVLKRLQSDGFWLIDAVEHPINKATKASRNGAIRAGVPRLVERCRGLTPERGVVICHGGVYAIATPPLRAAGVRLLHDRPLPFPLGNWRKQFVSDLRQVLGIPASSR